MKPKRSKCRMSKINHDDDDDDKKQQQEFTGKKKRFSNMKILRFCFYLFRFPSLIYYKIIFFFFFVFQIEFISKNIKHHLLLNKMIGNEITKRKTKKSNQKIK